MGYKKNTTVDKDSSYLSIKNPMKLKMEAMETFTPNFNLNIIFQGVLT